MINFLKMRGAARSSLMSFSSISYTEKTPITVSLWEKRCEAKLKEKTLAAGAPVTSKKPSDSRVDVRYDFGCTPGLKELYVDSFGNILMGKLLEDLDALAGNVAFFHCDDQDPQTSDLSLVTAGVEQIKFERKAIPMDNDVIVTGQVVYKGSSSLDVLIEAHVAKSNDNDDDSKVRLLDPAEQPSKLLSSVFTYVARDKETGRAAKVINLDLSDCSPHEQSFFEERSQKALERKRLRKEEKEPIETRALQNLGKSIVDMPALAINNSYVLQQTTALENSFICEPQKSNTGGRVFGGFLINKAYMLAQANAYLFSGMQAHLTLVDKITFKRPVEIGDLIRLRSRVTYASNETPRRMVVQCTCDVVHPEKGQSHQSNKFTFVFTCSEKEEDRVNRKMVVPINRLEAESLVHSAVNILGLEKETVEAEILR